MSVKKLTKDIANSASGTSGLPNGVYIDKDYFSWESKNLLASNWFGIGFGIDVSKSGSIKKVDVLGTSLIMVRGENETIRVFYNVCRHRGRQLVDRECDQAKLIRCPYHAWTYRLDGSLNGTPHIGGAGIHKADDFDPTQYKLFEVHCKIWMDIVFVNLNANAESFDSFIDPLEARLLPLWGESGSNQYRPAADGLMSMEVKSNWKLAVENYLEAYHLPIIHPGLNSYSPLSKHYLFHDAENFAGQGVTSYNPQYNNDIVLPSASSWSQQVKLTAEYPAIYPNILFGIQHDHAFTMLLLPVAENRTLERVQLQFVGDASTDNALAETRKEILEAWRSVFQEDVGAVEGMQAGRHCDVFDGGVFTPTLEHATKHFHRWYERKVTGMLN